MPFKDANGTPIPKVVDVSKWQPDSVLDFAAMRDAGIVGVIIKATEGLGYADPTYVSKRAAIASAGLLFDAYHFLRPGNMLAQAAFFVRVAKPDGNMRLWADYEVAGVSLDDLLVFCREVSRLTGRTCGIYSGFLIEQQLAGRIDPRFKDFALWGASYTRSDTINPTWKREILWQFEGDRLGPWGGIRVRGAPIGTDLSAYSGPDDAALRAEWNGVNDNVPAQPSPPPAPLPGPAPSVVHNDAWRMDALRKLGAKVGVAYDRRAIDAVLQILLNDALGGSIAVDGWFQGQSQNALDAWLEKKTAGLA